MFYPAHGAGHSYFRKKGPSSPPSRFSSNLLPGLNGKLRACLHRDGVLLIFIQIMTDVPAYENKSLQICSGSYPAPSPEKHHSSSVWNQVQLSSQPLLLYRPWHPFFRPAKEIFRAIILAIKPLPREWPVRYSWRVWFALFLMTGMVGFFCSTADGSVQVIW